MKTAYNLWGPQHRFFIDPIFDQRVVEGNVPARNQAALRSSIYKELFEDLSQEEQAEWTERAQREHQEAIAEIDSKLKGKPSTKPEDRQKYVHFLI